ncbi:hypothetical protein Vadar_033742 [Vaccinium darrowii]|uniref:Uncharacterized protein n=1 Tax=Vaccinium darrowii TaxID=229202 RepID=A0ACB7XEA0_9ERIC|nr:hypothetical protein Vadar_033742 [Vaccinium darrowii]
MQLPAFSQEDFEREKCILNELEITMLREEMNLHQRFRLNWIQSRDKNYAFFHATLIQRRQCNQLSKIKDRDGNWISEEDAEINTHLKDFFSDLFKSPGPTDFRSILGKVDRCITTYMNNGLIRVRRGG